MPRLRHLALALASAGLVTAASCSKIMQTGDQPSAQVIFVNQSLDQADVFAVRDGGQPQRIGTVFAGRTETLAVPANLLTSGGSMSIVVRLLARSFGPSTGPLTINDGDRIRVTLPSNGRSLSVVPAP
jgi:hypothetical protein